jgi:ABC-type branched-subunit amino acid transport system substrate-binding protein
MNMQRPSKLVLLPVLGLAALAIAGFAYSSGGPNEQLVHQDRLYGGGGTEPGCFVPDIQFCRSVPTNIAIDAQATQDGNAAAGDYVNAVGHNQVTCLAVHGHNAAVGGIIVAGANVGALFAAFYVDNGPPGSGADLVSPNYVDSPDPAKWPPGFPYVCPSPDTGAPAFGLFRSFIPLSRGDIVVQDADAAPASDATQVAVSRGQPIEIALAEDQTGFAASFKTGIENAVRMAVDAHPSIRGFPIQLNFVNEPCGDAGADVAAARGIAANLQNVGVLGQFCSAGFDQSLPVYEAAGLVTITGSATSTSLPSFGPTVFDRTTIDDADGFDAWYATVSHLPGDLAWRQAYTQRFGLAPTDFADLYYDAAALLIRNLESVSTVDHGSLVVNRAALAQAVRGTTSYAGVTCTVTLDPATGNRLNDPAALARCGAN